MRCSLFYNIMHVLDKLPIYREVFAPNLLYASQLSQQRFDEISEMFFWANEFDSHPYPVHT